MGRGQQKQQAQGSWSGLSEELVGVRSVATVKSLDFTL